MRSGKFRNSKLVGKKGEEIAQEFFERKGFEILEKNYKRKFFEIDLIVKKRNKIHFVEVKTILFPSQISAEEHLNQSKLKKIKNGALFYLREKKIDFERFEVQIDFLAIEIFLKLKKAKIRWLQGVY